ncbi:MAG: hypothetical protein WA231_12185 [Methylocella sp.]
MAPFLLDSTIAPTPGPTATPAPAVRLLADGKGRALGMIGGVGPTTLGGAVREGDSPGMAL